MKTIKELDKKVEEITRYVLSNNELLKKLKEPQHWQERWEKLEHYVLDSLEKHDLPWLEYQTLWIREIFFHGMQQKTGMDLGFCEHFEPAFKRRAEALLSKEYSIDGFNYCNHGGERHPSICAGTERDVCVIKNKKESGK